MDYQKLIDQLLERGWSMQLTFGKEGVVANFFHESMKQSYIPLPQVKGITLDDIMRNIYDYFKMNFQ